MKRPALLALLLPLPFAALPLLAVVITHIGHDAGAAPVVIQRPAEDARDAIPGPEMQRAGWNEDAVSSRDCGNDDIYAGT